MKYTFSGKAIADIILELPDKIAIDCREYEIRDENNLLAKLYGGNKFTFIKLPDILIRIDKIRNLFQRDSYLIYDHSKDSVLGSLEFSDSFKECTIAMQDGSRFDFHKDSLEKVFYKPSTWSKFRHVMTSPSSVIIFSGNVSKTRYFDGTIEASNQESLFAVVVGIFILEEKARIQNEYSG